VVEFAELWDFIDAPLRTYSSGMSARLAFAVATAQFADVILIDEVLAVGDIEFQEKCLERMDAYRQRGATIVFVSHDPGVIGRMCEQTLLLEGGKISTLGYSSDVIERYFQLNHTNEPA
jgi:ABC-type polysaccharide/polyol phosphate transport system ATPase subunit